MDKLYRQAIFVGITILAAAALLAGGARPGQAQTPSPTEAALTPTVQGQRDTFSATPQAPATPGDVEQAAPVPPATASDGEPATPESPATASGVEQATPVSPATPGDAPAAPALAAVDLAGFPGLLLENLPAGEPIVLVIPDAYSDADLEAAAAVAAGLGRYAAGAVGVDLITAAEATPDRLAAANFVVIGRPAENAFLAGLYRRGRLPTTLAGQPASGGAAIAGVGPDDGVVQAIPSEFGEDRVALVVTGSTAAGVARAARALSMPEPRYGFAGNLVVIEAVDRVSPAATEVSQTRSLADLGFQDTAFFGTGTHRASVAFFVPSNWHIQTDATLTLAFLHSAALRPGLSGLTVHLNGHPVGSVAFATDEGEEREEVIELPMADFRPGAKNQLTFEVTLCLEDSCEPGDTPLAWLRIRDSSRLHLPHLERNTGLFTLAGPLTPFVSRPDLADVWLALPASPTPAEAAGAIRLAWLLGNVSEGAGFTPKVTRGPIADAAAVDGYHVIAVGRPTANPILALVNDQLPQPFIPGEDALRQAVGSLVYRLPDDFSLGVLEVIPAPWQPSRAVAIVTGTTPEGVGWAIEALTDAGRSAGLTGDLAFVRAGRIEALNSADVVRGALKDTVEGLLDEEPGADGLLAAENAAGVPERYLPRTASRPDTVTRLIYALVGAGLAVAVAGIGLNWRKQLAALFRVGRTVAGVMVHRGPEQKQNRE